MPYSTALPLQRHPIFATRDPEEARAFLRLREFRLDLSAREAAHLDMRVNGVYLPGLYLGALQYGAAVEIRTEPSYDDYRFATPTRGRIEAVIARKAIACRPGTAILVSPTLDAVVRVERGSVGLNLNTVYLRIRIALARLIAGRARSVLRRIGKLLILRLTPRGLRWFRLEMTRSCRISAMTAS
jgi:hypothetical protein